MAAAMNAILERRTLRSSHAWISRKKFCLRGARRRRQTISPFAACQNPEINKRPGSIHCKAFGRANSDRIRFVSKCQKSLADDDGIKSGFYGALHSGYAVRAEGLDL